MNKILRLADMAIAVPTALVLGSILGYTSAYIHPKLVIDTIRKYKERANQTIAPLLISGGMLTGYGVGVYDIASRLINEPTNPVNYIPIILNSAVETIFLVERTNKRKNLERKQRRELRERQRLECRIRVD